MGILLSISRDTRQIMESTKDLLTLLFKILISLVTITQDVEDIILEVKDLSDMLHFSINSVDKSKVHSRIDRLKDVAEDLGHRVKNKHHNIQLLHMVLEDILKLRYGTEWENLLSDSSPSSNPE